MLVSALLGFVAFGLCVVAMRAAEWLYHRLRRTPDWSPHWGTWIFALLVGLWVALTNYGR